MTISATTTRWDYIGDGSTTSFTYNNRIFEDTDLEVYVDGALQTLDTNYSVTGVDSASGGEVQFTSAPANNAEIVILRNVTNTQGTNYPSGGPFPAKTVETDLDRRTVVDQEQDETLGRALKIPKSDQGSPTTELPDKATRADTFVKFDENGDVTTAAVADMPTAENIKTLYESNADTNEFSDAEQTKLAGIESGATADQTDAEIRAAVEAATDSNVFTDADHTKLDGVESGATADQTDAEIETAYNNQVSVVSQAEAEAGVATTVRRWTAQRVKQAIAALGFVGPASSTDNAWVRFDGTGGKTGQNGAWTEDDSGNATAGGSLNMGDSEIIRPKIKDYGETVNAIGAIGGGTQAIDLESGNVVTATVDTSETTFTFSNPPATGIAGSFTLILTNGGSQTVNWPASVDWAGGTAPTLTAAGVDVLTFLTTDAGTTWLGFAAGLDMQ